MNWFRRAFNTAWVAALAAQQRRVPFWPIERIQELQSRRLRAIVRHAYETVPFYRRVMTERGLRPQDFRTLDDLAALPLLDDLTVRKEVEQFRSERYLRRPLVEIRTSGAYSRVRKLIYWDELSTVRKLAYAERDRAVLNRLVGAGWGQVQLYVIPAESATLLMRRFWDEHLLVPRGLAHRHLFATDRPFAELVAELNRVRPSVVFSYGSYVDEFARFLADRKPEVRLPRVWMYGGDTLSASSREFMEKQLGCTVYTTYQSVETGKIGFECERRRGFHLNVDLCHVRLVDEAGRTVPPGQQGEVVISNLYNRAMVLLNYRVGDRGAMAAGPCACGRSLPLLEQFLGKINAMLTLPDGRRLIAGEIEMVFKDELRETLQAQLIQSAAREVLWRVVPFSTADREAVRRRLLERTRSVLGGQMEVRVEFVEDIPRTSAGKKPMLVPYSPDHGST